MPRVYDRTSPGWVFNETRRTITSITTDATGLAVVDLYYAGNTIGTKQIRARIGTAKARNNFV